MAFYDARVGRYLPMFSTTNLFGARVSVRVMSPYSNVPLRTKEEMDDPLVAAR